MLLDANLLNTQHYEVRIKGKVEQSRKKSRALPTLWCSSYRKGSLRATLDYGHQFYFWHLTNWKGSFCFLVFFVEGIFLGFLKRFFLFLFYWNQICKSSVNDKYVTLPTSSMYLPKPSVTRRMWHKIKF